MYQPNLKKEVKFGPRMVPLSDCLSKIFTNGVPQQSVLDMSDLQAALDAVSIDYDSQALKFDTDVLPYLQKLPAKHVRELIAYLCNKRKIALDVTQFSRLDRSATIDVFFTLFHITPEEVSTEIPKAETLEANKSERVQQEESEHKEDLVLSWRKDAASIEKLIQLAKKQKRLLSASSFEVDTTDLKFYEDLPVTRQDNQYLYPGSLNIEPSFVGICNAQGEVVAIGDFEMDGDKFYYQFAENNIDFAAFDDETSFQAVFIEVPQKDNFYASLRGKEKLYTGSIYQKDCRIDKKKRPREERPLCIDFGTSNTTAGSYGILRDTDKTEVETVSFEDTFHGVTQSKSMLPTIAYVEDCSDPQNIVYLFGYEARHRIQEQDYDTQASIFYEMKRWLNELDAEEEIIDEQGHRAKINHFAIVQAYLEHVINLSEKYFKVKFHNLHFSAPVKLKKGYLNHLAAMFPEPKYHVYSSEESLDEGVAIVYNKIMEDVAKVQQKAEADDEILIPAEKPRKMLVLDCGGGTTDLASCSYYAELDPVVHRPCVHIRTGFENGDMNFGGNNVTYRILQMLKIKLAYYEKHQENLEMSQIIPDSETDILSKIDSNVKNREQIYHDFEQAYQEAEVVVPTRFAPQYAELASRRSRIKRNYYYLWQMAENIKIEFYKAADRVTVDFSKEADRRISVGSNRQYHLDMWRAGKLETVHDPLNPLDITISEIERIIRPDIYALLNRLLAVYQNADAEKGLLGYHNFKMSGQSCNITLFHDLLKEFVPGKYIRRQGSSHSLRDELKMSCLRGCIEYCRDRDNDASSLDLQRQPVQKLLYTIYRQRGTENTPLWQSVNGRFALHLDRNTEDIRHANFVICDNWGKAKNEFTYDIVQNSGKELSVYEIENIIKGKTYLPDDIFESFINEMYSIKPEEGSNYITLLAVPAIDAYGIYIMQIRVTADKNGTMYFLQNDGQYFSFENDAVEYFFDGRR